MIVTILEVVKDDYGNRLWNDVDNNKMHHVMFALDSVNFPRNSIIELKIFGSTEAIMLRVLDNFFENEFSSFNHLEAKFFPLGTTLSVSYEPEITKSCTCNGLKFYGYSLGGVRIPKQRVPIYKQRP